MFTPSMTPNQIRSMPSLSAAGPMQRHDDEGDLEEVEEERQHEDQHVDDDEEARLAAGQRCQQVLDPDVAADAIERQREDARADQDEEHECRQLRGRFDACRSRSKVMRRLIMARMMAPAAPMAPPSVGVARPMKIVPSTRKIRTSGGTMTKVTCSARLDSERRAREPLDGAAASAARRPRSRDSSAVLDQPWLQQVPAHDEGAPLPSGLASPQSALKTAQRTTPRRRSTW